MSDGPPLVLTGRIMPASNATFLGQLGEQQVVYKPVAGEKPLWDFPDGTLAGREVAAYLVSQAMGWDVVPTTWLGDGPHGPGMTQHWQDVDPQQSAVDIVAAGHVPDGWRHVFDGVDGADRPVSLIHEDSPALRRMAVFDVITNNADRKGGHVLEMPDGHRFGVDHGLTLHEEHKLRTVLWGWVDEELLPDERAGVERVLGALDVDLTAALADLVTPAEVEALGLRCEALLASGRFPGPSGPMPAVPWPPF